MSQPLPRKLYRSKTDRMLSGVSGGLAEYFDIDPVLIRLLWVVAAIFTGGMAAIAYVALWIIVPLEGYSGSSTNAARENVGEIRSEAERLAERIRQSVRGEPIAAEQSSAEPVTAERSGAEPSAAEPVDMEAAPAEARRGDADAAPPRTYAPGYSPLYRRRRSSWAGIILILLGALFLASNLGLFWWFSWRTAWPVVLIVVGVLLLWNRARE